ncbi:MAG: glycoside hydrolase family 3 C-terminal domain-containing protein [Bacteroidales bacterium]|nr:glycoside hydrolase family 3 C-terminal domain-containing protein [Bacteroidales bacterium]
MKKITIIAAAAFILAACCSQSKYDGPVYLNPNAPVEERVEDALARMTMEEKVGMTTAQSKFSSRGVPRLGIPEVWHTDGPHGIRPEVLWDEWDQAGWTNDSCTAFPALVNLAATWDKEMSLLYGRSIGEEARYRKKDILLGPGINICRTPLNGRNFEYMGEDPFLAGQMVVPYVKGVQENGVAACVKHYAVNNQEFQRTQSNSVLDDRTLYEIYLPAFKAAVVEGGAWAIMGSYNLYNGQFNCHNKKLLCDILKGEWGFDGVVVSDWGGCRVSEEAILNGLDIEMGTWTNGLRGAASDSYRNYHMADPYLKGLREGKYTTKELDDKVRRILRVIFRTSMRPEPNYGRFVCPEHYQAARDIAAAGVVLLKNENNTLPLDVPQGGKIVLVGENAVKKLVVGGGSSNLKTAYEVNPLEGLQAAYEGVAEVVWERGYVGDVGTSYNLVDTGQDLSDDRSPKQLIAAAVAAAKDADYVIFIGGLNKSKHQDNESTDRFDTFLPYDQQDVIEALAEVAEKLVVVNISGSPVSMPWADKADAIVQGWYGGTESGNALADVLTGKVNPSGRLPFSIPFKYEDGPIKTERQYPGIKEEGDQFWQTYYDEGVYVGYRWYDSKGVPVQFPFGHGLSYSTFEYSDAKVSKASMKADGSVKVSVDIKNTGSCDGAEVVQLYIADPVASVDRPSKELKGFEKIWLKAGEKKTVTFEVAADALSFYDMETSGWKAEAGEFQALIGSSSGDIRTSVSFELK